MGIKSKYSLYIAETCWVIMFSLYIFKEVTTGAIGERTDIEETCEPAGNFVE